MHSISSIHYVDLVNTKTVVYPPLSVRYSTIEMTANKVLLLS